jgi:hypothetical protein
MKNNPSYDPRQAQGDLSPDEPVGQPQSTTEPTAEMINAAAREMWNDRDARHGGPWESRDAKEICVIQTKATARAALIAALSISRPSRSGEK